MARDDGSVGEEVVDRAGAALFPGFQPAQQFQYTHRRPCLRDPVRRPIRSAGGETMRRISGSACSNNSDSRAFALDWGEFRNSWRR